MEEQVMIMAIPALQMPVGIFISQGILDQLPELPQQVLTKPHMEGNSDAFLVKIQFKWSKAMGNLLWRNRGMIYGYSCATDASGNIYLSGYTSSTSGIATTGAHQATYGGGDWDAFLVKFNSSGVRQWGTYYGGTGG